MDSAGNKKEPSVLSEDTEKDHSQDICTYLRNLKNRLRQTVVQQTELIQSAVNILKEISEVSKMLMLGQSGDVHGKGIKRLILEFEHWQQTEDNKLGFSSNEVIDLRDMIIDFRRLDESQSLRDSLMGFKRAKDSLEKVGKLLDELNVNGKEWSLPVTQNSEVLLSKPSTASATLRDKIRAFNKATEQGQNLIQNFSSCFSNGSSTSLAPGDVINQVPILSRSHSGYEGDVDSEVDQVASHNGK